MDHEFANEVTSHPISQKISACAFRHFSIVRRDYQRLQTRAHHKQQGDTQLSRSKYAFISVDLSEVEGPRLDFGEAQIMHSELITSEQVEAYYQNKRDVALSDTRIADLMRTQPNSMTGHISSSKPFGQLESHQKKAEAWRLAGESLLSALTHGECSAYVKDPKAEVVFVVPGSYWEQGFLGVPHDGLLHLNTADWKKYWRLDGQEFFILESAVKKINTLTYKAKRGRKPKYDWPAARLHIKEKFRYHGRLSDDDPDWSCQADVEREIQEFFFAKLGYAPAASLVREKAKEFILEFVADN